MTTNLTDFALVDLSLLDGITKPFDGMAAGRFTDMMGRDSVFLPDELPTYVNKTKLALESTKNTSGEIVGFPIAGIDHRGGLSYGWIIDVNQAIGRDVIEITPRWNEIGREAIESDAVRFFSPTVDITNKVIIGGSLTNWPATRTSEHQILLRPVELSAQMQTYENKPIVTMLDMVKAGLAELRQALSGLAKPVQPETPEPIGDEPMPENDAENTTISALPVELAAPVTTTTVDLASPEVQSMIIAQAEQLASARADVILAERARAAEIVQLATRLTGGTAETPQGLPVAHDRLTAFLQALPPELLPEAESILCAAAEKPISFAEIGHSKVLQGTKPLPENIKPALAVWLASGAALNDFFAANSVELGIMSDYDLSDYIQGDK